VPAGPVSAAIYDGLFFNGCDVVDAFQPNPEP
jgi:hypothetical protein